MSQAKERHQLNFMKGETYMQAIVIVVIVAVIAVAAFVVKKFKK